MRKAEQAAKTRYPQVCGRRRHNMLPEAGYKKVIAEYGKVYFDSRITEYHRQLNLGFKTILLEAG
jgi:hypothetical protein